MNGRNKISEDIVWKTVIVWRGNVYILRVHICRSISMIFLQLVCAAPRLNSRPAPLHRKKSASPPTPHCPDVLPWFWHDILEGISESSGGIKRYFPHLLLHTRFFSLVKLIEKLELFPKNSHGYRVFYNSPSRSLVIKNLLMYFVETWAKVWEMIFSCVKWTSAVPVGKSVGPYNTL